MKKSRETSDSTFAKCLKYLVIGCIAGLFLCAALLAICAFVFVLVKTIPTQAIQAVSIGISALSAMFAGFLSAKLCHSKGLIMGLFSGLILFACVLISAFSTGGNVFTVSTAMRFLLMMIGGAFGGVLAVNKRKNVK